MSVTFTKLFSSITASTVWAEPDHTRIVWITMLAMADKKGRVWASIPGLANMARVSVDRCEDALLTLSSPDKYSRTKEHEGRRIEEIDGGWRLLNHEKYRDIRDEESIKESKRKYINARRASERLGVENVEQSRSPSISVGLGRANADAYTERDKRDTSAEHPCPYQKVVDLYHDNLPELPRARIMGEARKRGIKKMWAWIMTSNKSDGTRRASDEAGGLEWFAGYFARTRDNDFLMGRTRKDDAHAGWQCDIDFLMTEKGMRQVIEKTREMA